MKIFTLINPVFIAIIAGVMWRYPSTDKIYYVFMAVLCILIIINLIAIRNLQIYRKNFLPIVIFSLIFLYVSIYSYQNIDYVFKRFFIIYLIFLYSFTSFKIYGLYFSEKFYLQLTIFLNMLSILNLYQVFLKKPLLLNFMKLDESGYTYNFGLSTYRVMSLFSHPIICALFFLFAFLCNEYIIKKKVLKLTMQSLLLVNIYFTFSRSTWLAIIFAIFILIILRRKEIISKALSLKFRIETLLIFILISISFVSISVYNFQEIFITVINRFGDSLSFNSTDGSNLQRTMTIDLIWNYMNDGTNMHLFFGNGAGTVNDFMLENPLLIDNFGTTDNQYISILFEFGILGLILYICLVAYVIYSYFKRGNSHWTGFLSLLCFLVISFELFFFDASGWPVVLVMFSYTFASISYDFSFDEIT